MSTSLGRGVYSYEEAARLTGLKASRVREWFRRRPMFTGDYPPIGREYSISFYDLVDVYVAGNLREHGVSLQTLRKVYVRMRDDLGTDHPFCRRELLSDGKQVFLKHVDADGAEQLIEVLTRQGVFAEFILPFLKAIDYDQMRLLARRWRIATGVVVDPELCFGTPVVEAVGIPTSILAAALRANSENADLVARWYGVRPADVLAASWFESRLAA